MTLNPMENTRRVPPGPTRPSRSYLTLEERRFPSEGKLVYTTVPPTIGSVGPSPSSGPSVSLPTVDFRRVRRSSSRPTGPTLGPGTHQNKVLFDL